MRKYLIVVLMKKWIINWDQIASTTIPKDDQKAFISDLTKLELLNADFNIQ